MLHAAELFGYLPKEGGRLHPGACLCHAFKEEAVIEYAARVIEQGRPELTLNSSTLVLLIEKWNEMAPPGRMGKPEELQSICVYLAGDTSTFTTGADFVVDGDFTCF